mgnify:FL=1
MICNNGVGSCTARPGTDFFWDVGEGSCKAFFCKLEEVKRTNNKIDKEEQPEKEKTTEDSEDAAG